MQSSRKRKQPSDGFLPKDLKFDEIGMLAYRTSKNSKYYIFPYVAFNSNGTFYLSFDEKSSDERLEKLKKAEIYHGRHSIHKKLENTGVNFTIKEKTHNNSIILTLPKMRKICQLIPEHFKFRRIPNIIPEIKLWEERDRLQEKCSELIQDKAVRSRPRDLEEADYTKVKKGSLSKFLDKKIATLSSWVHEIQPCANTFPASEPSNCQELVSISESSLSSSDSALAESKASISTLIDELDFSGLPLLELETVQSSSSLDLSSSDVSSFSLESSSTTSPVLSPTPLSSPSPSSLSDSRYLIFNNKSLPSNGGGFENWQPLDHLEPTKKQSSLKSK